MLHFEGGSNRGFRLPINDTVADAYHSLEASSSGQIGSPIDWLEANVIGLIALALVLAVVAGFGWSAVVVAPITGVAAIGGQWLLFD